MISDETRTTSRDGNSSIRLIETACWRWLLNPRRTERPTGLDSSSEMNLRTPSSRRNDVIAHSCTYTSGHVTEPASERELQLFSGASGTVSEHSTNKTNDSSSATIPISVGRRPQRLLAGRFHRCPGLGCPLART